MTQYGQDLLRGIYLVPWYLKVGFFACIIFGYTGDSYYQFFVRFFQLTRKLLWLSPSFTEASRCDVVSDSFRICQRLQFHFDVLHVGYLSEAHNQLYERFGG
jgi:hypothetical protein